MRALHVQSAQLLCGSDRKKSGAVCRRRPTPLRQRPISCYLPWLPKIAHRDLPEDPTSPGPCPLASRPSRADHLRSRSLTRLCLCLVSASFGVAAPTSRRVQETKESPRLRRRPHSALSLCKVSASPSTSERVTPEVRGHRRRAARFQSPSETGTVTSPCNMTL